MSAKGSLDVSPDANEAGQLTYAKQRPLGAGLCTTPARQETPTPALWNLGCSRVSQCFAPGQNEPVKHSRGGGLLKTKHGCGDRPHIVPKGLKCLPLWHEASHRKSGLSFSSVHILDPVVGGLLPLNVLLTNCLARSGSGTVPNQQWLFDHHLSAGSGCVFIRRLACWCAWPRTTWSWFFFCVCVVYT